MREKHFPYLAQQIGPGGQAGAFRKRDAAIGYALIQSGITGHAWEVTKRPAPGKAGVVKTIAKFLGGRRLRG